MSATGKKTESDEYNRLLNEVTGVQKQEESQELVAARIELQFTASVLEFTQRVLDCLPMALAGIDRSGMVVLLNRRATILRLGRSNIAVGDNYNNVLPATVCAMVSYSLSSCKVSRLREWRAPESTLRVVCTPFGGDDEPDGALLTWEESFVGDDLPPSFRLV